MNILQNIRVSIFFIIALNATSLKPLKNRVLSEKTVLVFDLHDVILTDNYSLAYKTFLTHVHWIRYNCILIKRLLNFGYNKKIKTTDPKKLSIEYALLHGITDEQFKKYVLTIINPHVINKSAAQYLEELGKKGFMRFAFSNIGEASFTQLQGEKTIDPLFDGKYICNAHDGYVTKASPEAFKNLLTNSLIPAYQKRYDVDAFPEKIIVVDDSLKKLKTLEQGFIELQQKNPALQTIKLVPVQFKNTTQMQTDVNALLT